MLCEHMRTYVCACVHVLVCVNNKVKFIVKDLDSQVNIWESYYISDISIPLKSHL
jgi:hypothetical protein